MGPLAEDEGLGSWVAQVQTGVETPARDPAASPELSHSVETQAQAARFQNPWGLPEPTVTHAVNAPAQRALSPRGPHPGPGIHLDLKSRKDTLWGQGQLEFPPGDSPSREGTHLEEGRQMQRASRDSPVPLAGV